MKRITKKKPESESWQLDAEYWKSECGKQGVEIKELERRLLVKSKKVRSLEVRFNQKLLRGRNRVMVLKYSEAIVVHLALTPEIIRKSKKSNGSKKSFPFLYETDGKRLARQFGISHKKALKILRQLEELGAWRRRGITQDRQTIYQIGQRKMNKANFAIDHFYLNPSNECLVDALKVGE